MRISQVFPYLIITKTTVAPDCKVSIGVGNPGEGEIQVDVNASGIVDWSHNPTEVNSVSSAMDHYIQERARLEAERREREIREELFAGETPNGNIMDYDVIRVPEHQRVVCAHYDSIGRGIAPGVNANSHTVQFRPIVRFHGCYVGFCHEKRKIYVVERRYRTCEVEVSEQDIEFEPHIQPSPDLLVMAKCSVHNLGFSFRLHWSERTSGVGVVVSRVKKRLKRLCDEQSRPRPSFEQEYPAVVSEAFEARRLLDEQPIPEEGRVVWPATSISREEARRVNEVLNEHYRRMVDRLSRQEMPRFYGADRSDRESLPQTSKPPISASTCSSCKAENLENFLRAGGKVYCHACFEKFPSCCFCGNKVPWESSYTSKRDDKRLACPPCIEERKGQKLVKEVAE
ncbi:hypothetical protein [Candidatus Manganitrophus noduliformans]|uniref:Uncharacterized protein n=1 Tax=Candidatus Manganitrophus noduliformans TaxID=2606439 RepID=A0A7X6DMF5_9BACT|nr:hypothetical protein [Candidatus Manganitrophus noduliformans]NKE69875.1 hypothetical protein [Candidatus Manganitrophus noduliformans]